MLTLTLGGAIFISVFSRASSLMLTLDDFVECLDYDIWLNTERSYRIEKLRRKPCPCRELMKATGAGFVTAGECVPMIRRAKTCRIAAPAGSDLMKPVNSEGRYLPT